MTFHSRVHCIALLAFILIFPPSTSAATLNISPAGATVSVGSTITATVFVASADQAMNAIDATVSFPNDLLQVVSVSKSNSILSLWVQDPTFSNTNGTISFSGVVPNPGYTGARGQVLTIQLRGKKAGLGTVSLLPSSQVLANDGNGTNILNNSSSASITVTSAPQAVETPPISSISNTNLLARITSVTHPDQTQWYKLPHAIFDWTNAQGVSAVRLGYDEDANGKPSVLYSDPISHKEIDLSDGIWYFHVQQKGGEGWGPISNYRVQIDTVAPLPFTVTFPQGTTTKEGATLTALFTTTDDLSGIDHYQVSINGKEFIIDAKEGGQPYTLSENAGSHLLLVRAYDKAGNVATTDAKFFVEAEEKTPAFNFFTFGWLTINYISLFLIALAILLTVLFGIWYIRVHFAAYRYKLRRRLGLTQAHIHKEFDKLKDAITDEMLRLEQVKSARALTREEEHLITRLKKLIDESEIAIEGEIEDIQK